jgi:alcohol dehydrogenase (NADP+)
MPQIGFGTWDVHKRNVNASLRAAVASGYRLFDLAPEYDNEAEVGETLSALQVEGIIGRKDLFLTSKVPPTDACDPRRLRAKIDQTLRDLRTNYVDLYLVHWPFCVRPGARRKPPPLKYQRGYSPAQLRDTWRTMEWLVHEGKARAIGLSNLGPNRLATLLRTPDLVVAPSVVQVELHPYNTLASLRAFCAEHRIAVTAYASLGSASRVEKFHLDADTYPLLLSDPAVLAVASALGTSASAVVLAWAVRRGVAVIPKSNHPDHIRANLLETLRTAPRMSESQLKSLDALDRGHRFLAAGLLSYAWRPGMTLEQVWDDGPAQRRLAARPRPQQSKSIGASHDAERHERLLSFLMDDQLGGVFSATSGQTRPNFLGGQKKPRSLSAFKDTL